MHDRNKRAKRRGAEGKHSAEDIARIWNEQEGLCAICGMPLDGTEHVDHIIPLSRGGSNWPDNIQLLCPPCNMTKGAKVDGVCIEFLVDL